MVPITRRYLTVDYIADQKLPVILVTSGRLGSINHTLLSIEALVNRGLSQRLDIPRKEARDIIEGYFASYPRVKEYMDRVVEKAKEEYGVIRRVPTIVSVVLPSASGEPRTYSICG